MRTDTLKLAEFSAKKIIAYKLSYVTVYFSQSDCKQEWNNLFKNYSCNKNKRNRVYTDSFRISDYGRRKVLLDSLYDLLYDKKLNADTIFITQERFLTAGLRGFDIGVYLDNSRCTVTNKKGEKQPFLIRQKVSSYSGPLAAWGGRRYYLPGFADFFYQETDWIS